MANLSVDFCPGKWSKVIPERREVVFLRRALGGQGVLIDRNAQLGG